MISISITVTGFGDALRQKRSLPEESVSSVWLSETVIIAMLTPAKSLDEFALLGIVQFPSLDLMMRRVLLCRREVTVSIFILEPKQRLMIQLKNHFIIHRKLDSWGG